MKKKTGILDGVRKQLTKSHNSAEILAFLAVAADDSMNIEHEENSAGPSEIVEVGFSLDQNNDQESESEDDLFGTAFERSLSHGTEIPWERCEFSERQCELSDSTSQKPLIIFYY